MGRSRAPTASAMQEREVKLRVRVEWAEAMELGHRIRRLQEAGTDVRSLQQELRQIFEQLRRRVAVLKAMGKERRRLSPPSSCSSSSSSSPSVASSVASTKECGPTAKDDLQVLNGNLRRFVDWFRDPARKRRRSGEEESVPRSPSSCSFISTPSSPSSSSSASFSSTPSAENFIPLKAKTRRLSSAAVDSDDLSLFGCPSAASVSSGRFSCPFVWPCERVEMWPDLEEKGGEAYTLSSSWEMMLPSSPSASASSCYSSIHFPLPALFSSAPSASSSA